MKLVRMMKSTDRLVLALTVLSLAGGCSSFKDWRSKQSAKARGEPVETPAAPATQRAFPLHSFAPKPPPEGPCIRPDCMSVNGQTIQAADVLEPVWARLERMAQDPELRPDEYTDRAKRAILEQLRATINEFVVIYEVKQKSDLAEKKEAIDAAVEGHLRDRINRDFDGSQAKFERYLAARGLNLEQYKEQERRRLVVAQYLREEILPRIHFSRRQLWNYYTDNRGQYETPARARLQMIDVPDRAFLERGRPADVVAQTDAHLRAQEQIRQAMAELEAGADFGEVAKQYSKGPNAANGGRWDWVSENPGLQGRWAQAGKAAFALEAGQRSGIIETSDGFFIVRVEEKVPGESKTFEQVQEIIEQQMREVTFDRLSTDFLMRLYARSSIQGYEPFRDRLLELIPKYQPVASAATQPDAG